MPVTERLEDPGSFTIQLNTSEVPFDEIRLMKELGQIIVTPAWFLHPELFADADLMAAARYSGVILGIEWEGDTITLRGQGPWWYLGDADGNGPVLGADVTYAAATVDDILKPISAGGILPDAIAVGTITTTGVGTYTGTFYAPQTCLSAVRTVLATLGMHARINPDWTMDACLATRDDVFVVSSPTVVVVKKGFGADPVFTGIEPTSLRDRIDAIRWVSKSIIEAVDAAGARSILSTSDRAVVPYQDGRGNELVRAVIQSGPSSDDVGFDTFHARALDQWNTQREEELSTDQFDFSGDFEVGDRVYVYAPELGFHDDANQIFYRGTVLSPVALQVPVDSWPVKTPEMGVYYRSRDTVPSMYVGDEETLPYGLAFSADGTKAYIVGTTSDRVYQYTLTTAWDISTGSYASKSMYVGAEETLPRSVAFSADGTKAYIVGTTSDRVYQYTLTIAWDISTGSYASKSMYVGDEETLPNGLAFSADGTKAYVVGPITDRVYQYTLTTAWDISTGSYASKSISVGIAGMQPYGVAFSADGTKAYIVGQVTSDRMYQYTLTTAWDISTGSYASKSMSVGDEEPLAYGVAFSADGTKAYIVGIANDTVYQYTLTVAWDISTGSYTGATRRWFDLTRYVRSE